jgi:hypothetical protein
MSEESSGRNGNRDFPGAGGEGRGAAWPGAQLRSLIPMRDRCENLNCLSLRSKCSVGALACGCMKGGQPRAAVLPETGAEVSMSRQKTSFVILSPGKHLSLKAAERLHGAALRSEFFVGSLLQFETSAKVSMAFLFNQNVA